MARHQLRYWDGKVWTDHVSDNGVQVIDAPVLHLDPASGTVIVPEPALTVDHDALAAFEQANPPARREPEPVPPGRYRIAVWAFTTAADADTSLHAAQAVAAAAQQVVNADGFGAQQVLEVMARVMTTTPITGVSWSEPSDLASRLIALAAEHRA